MKKIFASIKKMSNKLSAAVMALCMSMCMAVTCFAVDGSSISSSVDYKSIGTALQSGLAEMVSNVIDVAVAIVPIGLGVFGLGWTVKKVKSLFAKVA